MQACILKKNFFNSFASKFFEKCFSITCILRPVCAIIQRSNLNKKKIFLYSEFFRILIEKTVNWYKISARLSKLHFPCPKEQFEKDIKYSKKNVWISWAKFFASSYETFSTRFRKLLFTSPVELLSVFKFLTNGNDQQLKT